MNKEHFFVAVDSGSGGTDIESGYNSNSVSKGMSSTRKKKKEEEEKTKKVDEAKKSEKSSSGFLGLENLSQEQSFCLFNASKSYLDCLGDCPSGKKKDSCKYACASTALDDVNHCIYYEEPEEEEEAEEEEEEEQMTSLERMEKLEGAVYMPYAIYDTSFLEPKDIINLKVKTGIKFAQLSPDFEKSGGKIVNTESPYLLWGR
jgi:hypothetical protein